MGSPGTCRATAATCEAHINHAAWEAWQADLTVKFTLPDRLPTLRALLIIDNLAGHKTPAFVLQILALGVMPVYTPLGGSWLNMAESIQRIITRDRKSTRLNSSHSEISRMPSSA